MSDLFPFMANGKTYQLADHTKHGIAKKVMPIYTKFLKDNELEIEVLQLQLEAEKISPEQVVSMFKKLFLAVENDHAKIEEIVCLTLRDEHNKPYPFDRVDDLPQRVFDETFSALFFGSPDFLKNIKMFSTSTAEAPTTDSQPSITLNRSQPETIFQKFLSWKKLISKVFLKRASLK